MGGILGLLLTISAISWSCSRSSDPTGGNIPNPNNPGTTENYSEDIKIPVISATGPDAQSGTPLSYAYDGATSTFYHSSWVGTTLPQSLVFTLKSDAAKLDYIYLRPRGDGGSNGAIIGGEVWVSTRDNDTFVKVTDFSFTSISSVGIINLPNTIVNPAKVKIVVTHTDGEKDKFISLAEIECWQTNPNKANFLNLFTDGSCTEVKPGITRDAIAAIADTVLRNIGLAVYDKKIDSHRIAECQSYPDPAVSARSNKTSKYGYVDNVTGIYLSPSSDAYIFVGGVPVAPVIARVIDHNSNGITYTDYPLKPGLNKFKPTAPGLVYLIYQSETDSKLKIFFARGYINGYFDLKKSNPNEWFKMINGAATSYFDLKGDYTVVTFPTDALKSLSNADIVDYIKTWDQIVYKEQEFMGLAKYNRMQKTRMYVKAVTDPSAYMYSTDYFTAYQLGTINALNSADKLKHSGIWGPAHEIGHSNQVRPDFKWPGMTECSNNVCSMYMQTFFGGLSASRIQSEDLGGESTRYQKAFDRFFKNDGHNHFTDDDVFCKLIPFWQLQLYFSYVNGYTDFYKDLLEVLRNQKSPDINHCHLEFYKKCCDITQTDLTDFFSQWGLLMPFSATIDDYATYNVSVTQADVDAAVAYVKGKGYAKPAMPIQYIQDNTVGLYTSSTKFEKGTATVSGSSVLLSGCKNAVVFIVKAANGAITKVYPPKENGGGYSFVASSSDIGSIEAVDATGAATRIY
jgi:F5/8 type C domain.